MKKKKFNNPKSTFSDSDLPINDLSIKRIEEIERLVLPKLQASFEKLRQDKPHLFNSISKK